MRISDWSSDVCSSGLRRSRRRRDEIGQSRRIQIEGVDHLEHSLNLRRLERRFRTMTAAAARMDRWCEFRPLAKFSKRQRSVMGIVIFPHGDDFFALEPQQPAILIIVEFAVGAIDLGLPFLEDDIPIRQDQKSTSLNSSN